MKRFSNILNQTALLTLALGTAACAAAKGIEWVPVSGTGVHEFTSALVHGEAEPTPTGFIQRSTDIIQLRGDLEGRVLYHPVSTFDFTAGTLVNRGHQVFSGTVLGGEPVLLFDDEYRFEVDLGAGTTVGEVYLTTVLAGDRRTRCVLHVTGTGEVDAVGDGIVAYTGRCRVPAARKD